MSPDISFNTSSALNVGFRNDRFASLVFCKRLAYKLKGVLKVRTSITVVNLHVFIFSENVPHNVIHPLPSHDLTCLKVPVPKPL